MVALLVAASAKGAKPDGAEASSDFSSADPAESKPAFLAGANLGLGLFKGVPGPWGELGIGGDLTLNDSLELRATLGGFISRHAESESEEYHQPGIDEDNRDELWAYGAILRATLALELGDAWRARAGPVLGYAHVSMESTQCGSASLDNPFWGFALGPSYRLGSVEFSATGELLTFPFMRCTNAPPNADAGERAPTVHVRDELSFDDPTMLLTLAIVHRWH